MSCVECGAGSATAVRVEYVESRSETLRLCEACRQEFADGDLVSDVTTLSNGDDAH